MQARRAVAPPIAGRHRPVLADELARRRQRQQDCMFRNGGGIRAAIVAERHARAPGRIEVGPVVAGAQQLDQFELRAGLEQRLVHEPVHKTDEIFGAAHRLQICGAARRRDGQLETRRRHVPRGIGGVREIGDENDPGLHGLRPFLRVLEAVKNGSGRRPACPSAAALPGGITAQACCFASNAATSLMNGAATSALILQSRKTGPSGAASTGPSASRSAGVRTVCAS